MNKSFIQLCAVKKSFSNASKDCVVLDNVTMTFWQGTTYAIQGTSGVGKSSLMHMLAGLDQPTGGTLLFNEMSYAHMSPVQRNNFLQQHVGLLFQQPYLIKELTVLENVMLPRLLAQIPYQQAYDDAIALIAAVDLKDFITSKPGVLSGGQQQRIALARALINRPAFLLADEPTGNLDAATGKKIVDLMITLHKQWGIGIIVTTHDTSVAHAMQTHYMLKNGSLIAMPKPYQ